MIKNINHGYTMDYFVKGIFAIIFGLSFTFIASSWPYRIFGISLLIFGISLLFIQTGISIDGKNRRIRKLRSLFGFHFGKWHEINSDDYLKLGYTNKTAQLVSSVNILDVHSKTFDLIIIKSEKEIEIYEFGKYKSAIQCIQHLEDILKIKVVNRFEN